jgi:hypothetical protein
MKQKDHYVLFWECAWCMLFSGGALIKEAHHQKEKNQFGITPTTKLTIDIPIFILVTH